MPYINKTTFANHSPANRIVSLVPSITELLFDLGLNQEVLGITKFCVHPKAWQSEKTIVGGTKNLNIEKIRSLYPDLIIANKEEQVQAQIELLALEFPVYLTDIDSYSAALEMIENVGILCNKSIAAQHCIHKIKDQFQTLVVHPFSATCIYLIWYDPIMVAGKQTYIDAMLEKTGFINCLKLERYPELNIAQIQQLNPEYILLSTEPYPFKEKHIAMLKTQFPNSKVKIVDGELFSWYGSRMQLLPEYIIHLTTTDGSV